MTEAFVTPRLVEWARERQGLTPKTAAHRINVKPERLDSWEKGEARPTFRQAQDLAQRLHIPFGYLFLSAPPSEELPLPDLRTVGTRPLANPSPELSDVVQDALRKQQWYREYQEEEGGSPLPFIGRYSLSDSPDEIAADIRGILGINEDLRQKATDWEEFMRLLVRQGEEAGILVLRSGVVGNNTHRKLSVAEFQGFALSDDLAPLVFINGQDWRAAQIFTLAHELAHLWIGQSGISNLDYRKGSSQHQNSIERLCDQVAAETLVPKQDFLSRWQAGNSVDVNLQILARRYRVSQFVVLRRAYENDLLTGEQYRDHYEDLRAKVKRGGTAGGGEFYANLLARNSSALTLALLSATAAGRVPYRDAARLLNVKIRTLTAVYERLLGSGQAHA